MKKKFLTFLLVVLASCGILSAQDQEFDFVFPEDLEMLQAALGPFTAGPGKQIYFAPGNLQYQASTDTWRFAPHQYDVIGQDNENVGPTYDGWIDVFPWGTGNNPTMITHTTTGYDTFTDWGINPIDNYPADTWRTMTDAELEYVFYGRTNAGQLWGAAKIGNIRGVILLPDDWAARGVNVPFRGSVTNYYTNSYSTADWALMEAAGAVFLPAAGYLETVPTSVMHSINEVGMYWTSTANPKPYTGDIQNGTYVTYYDITQSDELMFNTTSVYPWYFGFRYRARSVRLVNNEFPCDNKQIIFTEDFGGNNPPDPQISATPYPNLAATYTQSTTNMGGGKVMITKRGWHNPYSTSWFEQCDHNYPGDYTRGYFMEVDGLADNGPVVTYGMRVVPNHNLHCECYVANVDAYEYGMNFAYAQIALEVVDARTGQQLALKDSGPLPYPNGYPTTLVAPWHLIDVELTLPNTTDSIELRILNTAASRDGNDFAIDDISVWECTDILPIEISGCDSVEYSPQGGATEVFYKDTTFVDQSGAQVEIKVHNSVHTARTLQGEEEVVYKGVTYTESTMLLERDTTEFGCERVDTIHIDVTHVPEEYLDSLIVNEMNWIICCNNRLLRAHYPADTYDYQWYKDGQPVSSYYPDYHDYYTEDRRLQGEFYLIVKAATDVNGTMTYKRVRSNTITIAAPSLVSVSPNPASQGEVISITAEGPFQYRLVTLSGLCLAAGSAEQNALLPVLPQGIYLVEILQENEVSTLKLMVR